MKDFLKNKKIIFPIVIGLVIIVIAIIIFILIGKSTNNSGKVSTIKLSNSTGNNSTTNVTNVTDNALEKTSKIALAHLNEFPNYYNKEYGLPMFEKYLQYRLNN